MSHDTPLLRTVTVCSCRASITGFHGTRHELHTVIKHRIAPAGKHGTASVKASHALPIDHGTMLQVCFICDVLRGLRHLSLVQGYQQIARDNNARPTLVPAIQLKMAPDSIVYTDSFGSYEALDVSQFHHVRINHSKEFARGRNHINNVENFWNQARRVLRKYNGIPKDNFPLFL